MESTINQNGEIYQYTYDEMGRIVSLNDHYYLRFEETTDEGEKLPTWSIT